MSYLRQCTAMAARGWVAASIQYRFSDVATWPAQLEDVGLAVAWLREYTGAKSVSLAGGSAGGYLAAMAALQPELDISAAVLSSPMTDMRAPGSVAGIRDLCDALLGDADPLEASPIANVHSGAPPMLIIAGDADIATPVPMIREFHDALTAAGVVSDLRVFPGRRHGFGQYGPDWGECFELTSSWLQRHG